MRLSISMEADACLLQCLGIATTKCCLGEAYVHLQSDCTLTKVAYIYSRYTDMQVVM